MNDRQIQIWPIDKITPYANNPRHNEKAVAAVAESIKAFGHPQVGGIHRQNSKKGGHNQCLKKSVPGIRTN